jgi:rhodanese-related sulfurtransferase
MAFDKLDKTQPVYIYCRSGNRSAKSAIRLQEMGFEKIYDLEGWIYGLFF